MPGGGPIIIDRAGRTETVQVSDPPTLMDKWRAIRALLRVLKS